MIMAEPNGILLFDKPAGLSSAAVVARVKKRLKLHKAGHAGTLDPFATGLLIVCVNRATKLMQFLVEGYKQYEAELILGIETDSQDITGKITKTAATEAVTKAAIFETAKRFLGTITQTPPAYSALKHKGVPLYRLARKGKSVTKPDRKVNIRQMEILEIALPRVCFRVECSAGTYVRTLGADMGSMLGCGGHLSALRRIKSSGFDLDQARPLDTLDQPGGGERVMAGLIPLADALKQMPSVTANEALACKLKFGQVIVAEDFGAESRPLLGKQMLKGRIKVVSAANELLAVLDFNQKQKRFDYCCSFAD